MRLTADGGYGTFLGGSDNDYPHDIAIDSDGNSYVVGWAWSFDFPSAPGLGPLHGRTDGFVVKLDTEGNIVYATFLGGSQDDEVRSVAVNTVREAYITGGTSSSDFPTRNAQQPVLLSPGSAFVTKLKESGTDLVYSTFLGGQGRSLGVGIAVDPRDQAHVTGVTQSTSFPTTPHAFSSRPVRGTDSFVTKFTPTGSLKYSTLLGGLGCRASGIALGGENYEAGFADVFVTGTDQSRSIPGTPIPSPHTGGFWDAFVARLELEGTSLKYLAYIGGRVDEAGAAIALDQEDNAYVTGWAESDNFFTTDGVLLRSGLSIGSAAMVHHCFVVKLDQGGNLDYSILLQGDDDDWAGGIAVDNRGRVYVTGGTLSVDFPLTHDPLPSPPTQCTFIAILNNAGQLDCCTFLGGGQGTAIVVNEAGDVYVTGQANSARDFPVGAPTFRGGNDAYVARVHLLE
jgi:hypothetical protein